MTVKSPDDSLVESAERCGRQLIRGILTVEVAVGKLFDIFAGDSHKQVHLARRFWDLIPDVAQTEFIRRIEEALQPGFRRRPFVYGGGRPATEDELRRDADEQTARVKAWAMQFKQLLAGKSTSDFH